MKTAIAFESGIGAERVFHNPEQFPDLPERYYSQQWLHLIQESSSGSYTSWTLYRGEQECPLRRVDYDAAQRGKTLLLRGVEGAVPAEIASGLIAELTAINVPPFVEIDMHGCDGESFELFHRSGLHSAKFRWWSVPPEPWEPLVAFHERTVELFNDYLQEVK